MTGILVTAFCICACVQIVADRHVRENIPTILAAAAFFPFSLHLVSLLALNYALLSITINVFPTDYCPIELECNMSLRLGVVRLDEFGITHWIRSSSTGLFMEILWK